MIVPRDGVAFTEAADGDMRGDPDARARVARRLDLSDEWAIVHQVHGVEVIRVDEPGLAGDADALFTTEQDLPLAVFTADCLGVVLIGEEGVGVAHAGWRGMAAGVVSALRLEMIDAGVPAFEAHAGPGIGTCCFEVGSEVAACFPGHVGHTTWGTDSVDLLGATRDQLAGITLHVTEGCTMHQGRFESHRRNRTEARMATLGWR